MEIYIHTYIYIYIYMHMIDRWMGKFTSTISFSKDPSDVDILRSITTSIIKEGEREGERALKDLNALLVHECAIVC